MRLKIKARYQGNVAGFWVEKMEKPGMFQTTNKSIERAIKKVCPKGDDVVDFFLPDGRELFLYNEGILKMRPPKQVTM